MADNSPDVRVMIVDDSTVLRGLMRRIVERDGDCEVVASAADGRQALAELKRHEIDVILLDIEMPIMDGMTALPQLLETSPGTKIIMTSTLTLKGAEVTMRALDLGAADFVPKPTSGRASARVESMAEILLKKIRTHAAQRSKVQKPQPQGAATPLRTRTSNSTVPVEIVVIGSSTGGPNALEQVMSALPESVNCPVLITQHMPPMFTTILARRLDGLTGRKCCEAETGMPIEAGCTYLAPGDFHLTVAKAGARLTLELNQEAPVHFCRPAVDVMFRSVAEHYQGRALAVVLTGMGEDGRDGVAEIVRAGGQAICQDEATSVVWGMPGAVAKAGLASEILPLEEIGPAIGRYYRVRTTA